MSKPRKDEPLKTPHYRGGNEALFKFIKSNLNYPEEALANKIEGDVEASYDVDGLGRTRNIKIVTSLGYGCDEEVKRLIGLLKYEKAFNKGRNVTLHRKLKVNFKLPEPKLVTKKQINYQLVKEKKSEASKSPAKKQDKVISYTIKLN